MQRLLIVTCWLDLPPEHLIYPRDSLLIEYTVLADSEALEDSERDRRDRKREREREY